jgi:hypothetical protein
MRPRDMWNRNYDRREPERRRLDEDRRDFGQADYSEDYAYDPATRTGYRQQPEPQRAGEDYGQADFSRDYGYDPATRTAYRRDDERRGFDEHERRYETRSFDRHREDEARREELRRDDDARRRGGSSDRLLRAIVTERINNERRLDSSDIEVRVEDGVVFLDGTARNRDEKRRAEDLADIDDVVDVVNGLRVRPRSGWRRSLGL